MPEWQLVYRIVGDKERETLVAGRKYWYSTVTEGEKRLSQTKDAEQLMVSKTESFMKQNDFGKLVYYHINNVHSTGYIGGPQLLVSLFTDIDKLENTTDPILKNILQSAKYLLTFQIRKSARMHPRGRTQSGGNRSPRAEHPSSVRDHAGE